MTRLKSRRGYKDRDGDDGRKAEDVLLPKIRTMNMLQKVVSPFVSGKTAHV